MMEIFGLREIKEGVAFRTCKAVMVVRCKERRVASNVERERERLGNFRELLGLAEDAFRAFRLKI